MMRLLYVLVIFAPMAFASESIWTTDLDSSVWLFDGNKYRCELTHPVEGFGKVKLVAKPAQSVSLEVKPESGMAVQSLLSSIATPPYWRSEIYRPFTYKGSVTTTLDGGLHLADAQDLYESLSEGDWLWISMKDANNDIQSLVVSNVRFGDVTDNFNRCRSGMLPISYATARQTVIHYQPSQVEPDLASVRNIKLIAVLMKNEPSIRKVLVDGYSDNQGSWATNMRMSRERAEEVAALLVENGVPLKKIEIRGHGDRFPVADNNTPQGRDKNRRVVIRLIKMAPKGKARSGGAKS